MPEKAPPGANARGREAGAAGAGDAAEGVAPLTPFLFLSNIVSLFCST